MSSVVTGASLLDAVPGCGGGARALVATLGGRELALVMAPELGAPVRSEGRPVERHERQLGDRQPGVQLDRDAREIVELERERALPAGIAEAGGGVDDQREAADDGFAFDSRDDVIGELDPLERAAEAELPGVD